MAAVRFFHVCLSLSLSVRMEQLGCHVTDFHEIWYLSISRTYAEKIQILLKSDKSNGTLHEGVFTFVYLAEVFLEWEVLQIKVVEKTKTHILCSVTFCRKSCHLWNNVEKYGGARQAKDDNTSHALCMLSN